MKKLIYIVEDEENIRDLVCATLNSGGYEAKAFEDGQEFWKALGERTPQLVLLDIMLPEEPGTDILRRMRTYGPYENIPAIFLTAKSGELDKVHGLDLGADDYMVKPFGVLELLARVKAVLRRYEKQQDQEEGEFRYKDLVIDTRRKGIFRDGEQIILTYKEYELFLYLYQNRGIVLSRDRLLEQIWNYDFEGETRTVDAHIRSLRGKLGDDKNAPSYIRTNRGHGYQLLRE